MQSFLLWQSSLLDSPTKRTIASAVATALLTAMVTYFTSRLGARAALKDEALKRRDERALDRRLAWYEQTLSTLSRLLEAIRDMSQVVDDHDVDSEIPVALEAQALAKAIDALHDAVVQAALYGRPALTRILEAFRDRAAQRAGEIRWLLDDAPPLAVRETRRVLLALERETEAVREALLADCRALLGYETLPTPAHDEAMLERLLPALTTSPGGGDAR